MSESVKIPVAFKHNRYHVTFNKYSKVGYSIKKRRDNTQASNLNMISSSHKIIPGTKFYRLAAFQKLTQLQDACTSLMHAITMLSEFHKNVLSSNIFIFIYQQTFAPFKTWTEVGLCRLWTSNYFCYIL